MKPKRSWWVFCLLVTAEHPQRTYRLVLGVPLLRTVHLKSSNLETHFHRNMRLFKSSGQQLSNLGSELPKINMSRKTKRQKICVPKSRHVFFRRFNRPKTPKTQAAVPKMCSVTGEICTAPMPLGPRNRAHSFAMST